jgi:hypothetical protein
VRGRGHLRCLTVLIRHENVMRLLELLGTLRRSSRGTRKTGSRGSVASLVMTNSL